MVKHIVTFKFKGTESERLNIANKFKEALILLPEQIDVLQSIEVGINQNPIEKWDLVLKWMKGHALTMKLNSKQKSKYIGRGKLHACPFLIISSKTSIRFS